MARSVNGPPNGEHDSDLTPDGYRQVPQRYTYSLRCGHIDYDRPPREDDHGEAHWRCPAWFVFDPYAEHDWQRLYCTHHRFSYMPGPPSGPPARMGDIQARVIHDMPSATADGLSTEERAWAAARKQELRDQAIEAGFLSREPGDDDR